MMANEKKNLLNRTKRLANGASEAWTDYAAKAESLQQMLSSDTIGQTYYDSELEKAAAERDEVVQSLAADAMESYKAYEAAQQADYQRMLTGKVTADDLAALTLLERRDLIPQQELQAYLDKYTSEKKIGLIRKVREIADSQDIELTWTEQAAALLTYTGEASKLDNNMLQSNINAYTSCGLMQSPHGIDVHGSEMIESAQRILSDGEFSESEN